MPIVALSNDNPFVDGRQSARALEIRLGVERYFAELNWACLPELTLKDNRRADLVALSPKGKIAIVEIKSSIEDFRADNKWPQYSQWCDELIFATLPDVPADIFPQEAGLMIADQYGADIFRPSPVLDLNAARRKTMHLRFARASAQRLTRCCNHAQIDSVTLAQDDQI